MPAARSRFAHCLPIALVLATALAALQFARPAPAMACSCGYGDALEMADYADVVFLGRVIGASSDNPELQAAFDAFAGGPIETSPLGRQSWTGMVTTTFAVEAVYKGVVAPEAVVHSHADGDGCGTLFGPTMRYVVFARNAAGLDGGGSAAAWGARDHLPGARLVTTLCDGSFVYFGDAAKQRAAVLGEGRPPAPDAEATAILERLAATATSEAGVEPTGTPLPVVAALRPAEGADERADEIAEGAVAVASAEDAAGNGVPGEASGAVLGAALVAGLVGGGVLWAIRSMTGAKRD